MKSPAEPISSNMRAFEWLVSAFELVSQYGYIVVQFKLDSKCIHADGTATIDFKAIDINLYHQLRAL